MPEEKTYLECNLPSYLQLDLEAFKNGDGPMDCLWCELYGSINDAMCCNAITDEQAWYLRGRYLNISQGI